MESRGQKRAFTLIELLTVIALVLILLGLLVPTLSSARERGYRTVCMGNMRALQSGYNFCAMDNDGALASPDTGSYANDPDSVRYWAGTYDLTLGTVWPYVRNEKSYACPAYPIPARDTLKRHYSISDFAGCDLWSRNQGSPYGAVSMSQVRRPSLTQVFVEEFDNRTIASPPSPGAMNGYMMGMGGNWVDCPPTWHNNGANFSFLDGHVDYHHWVGPKMQAIDPYTWFFTQNSQFWPTTPLDAIDCAWMIAGTTNGYVK